MEGSLTYVVLMDVTDYYLANYLRVCVRKIHVSTIQLD